MGSQSDWETMKGASDLLNVFKVPHEIKIISAHRTPDRMYSFAKSAEKKILKSL